MKFDRELTAQCLAEMMGTWLMVLFGIGSVASAVLTGSLQGLWQVATVWGFGVGISIYSTASISGAHLNPAVTIAFALLRPKAFPKSKVLPYICAQMVGAILCGFTTLALFYPMIGHYESANDIVRGEAGSEKSAMIFGEYFPNPAMFGTDDAAAALISPIHACVIEAFGTGVLMFVILATTDPDNKPLSGFPGFAPFLIGFTVACLISLFAPLTQAGWNPARDFGPRIAAAVSGWGSIAFGPRFHFWVYIVGPIIGAPIGGIIYDLTLKIQIKEKSESEDGSSDLSLVGGLPSKEQTMKVLKAYQQVCQHLTTTNVDYQIGNDMLSEICRLTKEVCPTCMPDDAANDDTARLVESSHGAAVAWDKAASASNQKSCCKTDDSAVGSV